MTRYIFRVVPASRPNGFKAYRIELFKGLYGRRKIWVDALKGWFDTREEAEAKVREML